jgi:MSHA biogenesis protein MshE
MSELSLIKKLKLGDLLVQHQVITHEQLQQALTAQKKTGSKLGDLLISLGFIDETELLLFLSKQLNMPFLELQYYRVKPEVIREIPESLARRYKIIPIDRIKNKFLVAVADPTDLYAYDEVAKKLRKPLFLVLVREREILRVIDEVFRRTEEIASLVGEIEKEIKIQSKDLEIDEEIGEAPIKKLLDSIFEDAIQVNASDIHIEPAERGLRIRQRVDGVLEEQVISGKNIISALILRLKLMAKLNISERRLPQDGRFTVVAKNKKIDVRMSTIPVQDGESCVLRLLFQTAGDFHLETLGFSPQMLMRYRQHLTKPYGMILLTGPTGSGKTTTLYASLLELNSQTRKIITIEDPVEYSFDRINQIQVQPKIGLDFANALRSILRNDPDILMIGEIRDEETALMALRSAITGHLVFSTIHTNDAASAPLRLIDMGVEAYLAASAIQLVIAQRLIKRNCMSCNEPQLPSEFEKRWLKQIAPELVDTCFMRAKGCSQCMQKGYKGRIGVFEFLEINDELADALRSGDINRYYQLIRVQPLYQPILISALNYAKEGLVSLEEIMKLGLNVIVE